MLPLVTSIILRYCLMKKIQLVSLLAVLSHLGAFSPFALPSVSVGLPEIFYVIYTISTEAKRFQITANILPITILTLITTLYGIAFQSYVVATCNCSSCTSLLVKVLQYIMYIPLNIVLVQQFCNYVIYSRSLIPGWSLGGYLASC